MACNSIDMASFRVSTSAPSRPAMTTPTTPGSHPRGNKPQHGCGPDQRVGPQVKPSQRGRPGRCSRCTTVEEVRQPCQSDDGRPQRGSTGPQQRDQHSSEDDPTEG